MTTDMDDMELTSALHLFEFSDSEDSTLMQMDVVSESTNVYNTSIETQPDFDQEDEIENGFGIVPIISAFVVFLFVTIINSLIIYVISRYKKLRTPSYTLMASISVFDILHAGVGKCQY